MTHHARPALARLREMARAVPPLYWAVGAARYLAFRRALRRAQSAPLQHPGLPPPRLRHRVHRALDEASYVAVGQAVAADLARALHAHGLAASLARVLDLGCGPGRVATWFKRAFAHVQLTGCDIDAEAIGWAQANLPEVARFVCNTPETPAPLPGAGFDLVYSVSLFTHLDERMQDIWLAEIARLLRPGGHLLATTHGEHAAASCTPSERGEVARRGIAFRVDRRGRFKLDGLPDFYQTTFHSEAYVRAHWSRFLDVVAFLPGGLGGHQDLVLLRRRG